MSFTEFLSGMMHMGSQLLLVPTMVVLVVLGALVLFCIGWVVVEYCTMRRHYAVDIRKIITTLHTTPPQDIPLVIASTSFLKTQAQALLSLAGNMGLPDEELFALAQVELERCEAPNKRRLHITDTIAKIAPMVGLMGTLIPLGPGLVALGQGDVNTLSTSMLIAFDTTITGLVCAIVALVISRVRRTWYAEYAVMLQAVSSCVLEEAAEARDAGVELPFGVDFEEVGGLEGLRSAAMRRAKR